MATLREARGLGAVGSLLILAAVIPNAAVLSIVGLILVLLAVKYIGEVVNDRELYGNMGVSIAFGIIGAIIGIITVFSAFYTFIGSVSTSTNQIFAFYDLIVATFLGLFLAWIFFLLSAYFLKKCYDSLALDLDEGLFSTSGRLFLIGAVFTIVFGIGLVIILIASALSIAAFLALPDEKPLRAKSTLSHPTPS